MQQIISKNKCCGCGACLNICPKNAINMVENFEGFLYPEINQDKCVNCGLCKNTCPGVSYTNSNFEMPTFYSGSIKDSMKRKKSSSGGIFVLFAEKVIERGGVVYGVIMDENLNVYHTSAISRSDLSRMQGSKYLQSDLKETYREVEKYLQKQIMVLFSGTPCQIAGLKNYLKQDYENLITIDLVCHGIPSPEVFRKSIDYNCNVNNIDRCSVKNIKFRGKGKKYKPSDMYYYYYYNENNEILYKNNFWSDCYGKAFGSNLILRPCCYNCEYSTFPRIGDITLGDFWGVDKINKKLNDNKGISIIALNNKQGSLFFELIKEDLINCEQITIEDAIRYNPNFYMPSEKHVNREYFFKNFNRIDNLGSLVENSLQNQPKEDNAVGILCFVYDNRNYGANLVAFAMCNIVRKIGYNPKVINFYPVLNPTGIKKYSVISAFKFRENFVNLTLKIRNAAKLKFLNNSFNTFIVGSDQVWNPKNTKDYTYPYFLDFVQTRKNIIAYAASFGSEKFLGNKKQIKKIKKLLERFDAISLRETSGVDLIHNTFSSDINCKAVLDPTLLVDFNDYENIIKSENIKTNELGYIGYYLLSNDKKSQKIKNEENLKMISEKLKLPLINIRNKKIKFAGKEIIKFSSYPEWLNYIKNAKFIITDSFHGVCFSIIFKKNFVYVNQIGGITRVQSLLSLLQITNRVYTDYRFLDIENLYQNNIDYNKVYNILNVKREESINFLKEALDKSKDTNFIKQKLNKEFEEKKGRTLFDKLDDKFEEFSHNYHFYKRLIRWGIYNIFLSEQSIFKINN